MLGLNAHIDTKKLTFIGVLVSLGIVFGDIGTSPLYVMKAIVNARKESGEHWILSSWKEHSHVSSGH